jgi:hypothetical protein
VASLWQWWDGLIVVVDVIVIIVVLLLIGGTLEPGALKASDDVPLQGVIPLRVSWLGFL